MVNKDTIREDEGKEDDRADYVSSGKRAKNISRGEIETRQWA